jgi:hypothetical protein
MAEVCVEPKGGDKVCGKQVRMAFRVTRPTRADIRLTVYTDDRVAPKTATRTCKQDGTRIISDMMAVLIDQDEDEGAAEEAVGGS